MGSRSKLLLELVLKENEDHVANSNYNASQENIDTTLFAGTSSNQLNKQQETAQVHRHRSESTSSTSSSSSSSSSGSSSTTTYYEDSDDSVKDPDYQDIYKKPKRRFSLHELNNITTTDQLEDSPTAENLFSTTQSEQRSATDSIATHFNETILLQNAANDSHYAPADNDNPNNNTGHVPIPAEELNVIETAEAPTPTKKGQKRQRQESTWQKNVAKKLRNSGKSYQSSKTKKEIPERKLKPPCKETCKFKCRSKITETQRQKLLNDYWNLGSIERQWAFILQSMEEVKPAHRYVRIDENGTPAPKRDNNNAFFFTLCSEKIRVCKTFYVNTLAINNRPIETALKKKNKETNVSFLKDNRGCHSNHFHVDDALKNAARAFIENIPKIESHYIRAHSKRHYIDGSKTISDIHRDYVEQCKINNVGFVNYIMFYRIFTQDFNISFFIPKKDACEFCEAYKNNSEEQKELKKEMYLQHQEEKRLSRIEKEKDKKDDSLVVAVYDLQAVFQCPKGEISVFYYKSKLNVLNLTIYDLKTNDVESFVWDESQANRGVNEIATCVFKYLGKISEESSTPLDVVFYSDNCAGQQKNKFMMAMYVYAVQNYQNINSITHKFLITGHTQNEGDSIHSQIERQVKRQLRSGPIYTPEGFIGAIKAARKKSASIHVNEMCYSDIWDWKAATNQINFVLQKDEDKKVIKLTEIKVFKVQKDDPYALYFKTSYTEEFKRAVVIKKKTDFNSSLKKAFDRKPGLAERKKEDILSLLNHNHIPGYYRAFFESL